MLFHPAAFLVLDTRLDPLESYQGPNAGPEEGRSPSDAVCGILLEGEDQDSDDDGGQFGTDTPEQSQSVEHLSEVVACLISRIESLSEFDATHAVNSNNVFYDPIDARA